MHKISDFKDITPKDGNVLAYCKKEIIGVILNKIKGVYHGRVLIADNIDCEYRITQIKNARLGKKWQSKDPYCIGFITAEETKKLLAGETVSRPPLEMWNKGR